MKTLTKWRQIIKNAIKRGNFTTSEVHEGCTHGYRNCAIGERLDITDRSFGIGHLSDKAMKLESMFTLSLRTNKPQQALKAVILIEKSTERSLFAKHLRFKK